jgi:hypothetical protein
MYEQLELMTYPTQTSGASASHARTSASQASKKACKKVSEADCFTKLCDCLPAVGKKIDPDGYSLKMLKIYLALETDLTSHGCCLKWGGYGYSLQWDTLNSKDYGVPQNRERVFIVCYLGNISGREIFPLRRTDGENPCELKEITQGVADAQRIYESDGLARTLKGESGGQGGKTGLYAVRFRYAVHRIPTQSLAAIQSELVENLHEMPDWMLEQMERDIDWNFQLMEMRRGKDGKVKFDDDCEFQRPILEAIKQEREARQ